MTKIVLVVGMHRSGTSLVSLFLNELGVNLGESTLSSSSANPTGHHEDLFFLDLHTRILNKRKGDWDSPAPREQLSEEFNMHTAEIKKRIKESSSVNSLWGWKDPRTSLFLDDYLNILPSAYVIYCTRESKGVEDSIYARNHINKVHTQLLKNHYDNEVLYAIEQHPETKFIKIDFDDVIKNPLAVITHLEIFLDLQSIDKEKIAEMVIGRKNINKIKGNLKKKEKYSLIIKSIKNPRRAIEVLIKRAYRKKWRKSWFTKNA